MLQKVPEDRLIYQQSNKAQQALDESFAPSKGNDEVLFHLPVTKNWLYQLILGQFAIARIAVSSTGFERFQSV